MNLPVSHGRQSGWPRVVRGLALAALLSLAMPALAKAEGKPAGASGHSQWSFLELIRAGGAVGIVIAALSVGMVALALEQFFALRCRAIAPARLVESVSALLSQRKYEEAARECRQSATFLGFVVAAGLDEVSRGYRGVEKAMEDACAQYSARLYRRIDFLSVIGTLSPMLGLLGTVWGMILAFSEFAQKTNVQITELAPGISTALVTTLLGLAVAIPAYAAYAHLRNRIDEAVVLCAQISEHLFRDFRREQALRRKRFQEGGRAAVTRTGRIPLSTQARAGEKAA